MKPISSLISRWLLSFTPAVGVLLLLASAPAVRANDQCLTRLPALGPDFRGRLGRISTVCGSEPARFSFEPSIGRTRSAADGAEEAALPFLEAAANTEGPVGPLMAAVIAALTPLAAGAGAVSARGEVVNWTELRAAENVLVARASNVCDQARLQQVFLQVAREQTGLAWPAATGRIGPSPRPADWKRQKDAGFDTALDLHVDDLRLERTSSSDASYALSMEAHVQLIRTRDGAVLYREPVRFRSSTGFFIDWTLDDAAAIENVAQHGYRLISRQVLDQLFVHTDGPSSQNAKEGLQHGQPAKGPVVGKSRARGQPGIVQIRSTALTPEMLANVHSVGLIATSSIPTRIQLLRPLSKDDAVLHGMEEARNVWASSDAELDQLLSVPYANAVVAATLVPISLANQAVGVIRGVPARKLERSDLILRRVVADIDFPETMRQSVARRIIALTRVPVKLVPKALPPGLEKECSQMSCFMAGTLSWIPDGGTPSYYLSNQGVDTALEIQLIRPALHGEGVINPPLALTMGVRASLIRVTAGEPFFSVALQYRGTERKFTDWAANNGQVLRDEVARCVETVSAAIVNQLAVPAWSTDKPFEVAAHVAPNTR